MQGQPPGLPSKAGTPYSPTAQMAETTHVVSFLGRFTVLHGAVRELWITFAVKVITILAYSVMNSTLVLWLSHDLGFNDAKAGYIVFGWSAAMTLFTVLVGSRTDAIGLRKAVLLGTWGCVFAGLVVTLATHR